MRKPLAGSRKTMPKYIAVSLYVVSACLNSHAQTQTLSGGDINRLSAAQDKKAISRLAGKQVSLTLTKRINSPYFEFPQDPGIVVLCPKDSKFGGGQVTSVIKSLRFDVDDGREFVNVLTLSSC